MTPGHWIAAASAIAFLLVAVRFAMIRRGKDPARYDSVLAWHRAALYFCACIAVSGMTLTSIGVVTTGGRGGAGIVAFTSLAFAVIIAGYAGVWRRGTLTHGREQHLPSTIGFGLAWGISEGVLFASLWRVAIGITGHRVTGTVLAYALIATWSGLWHARYWDIHVAPEHNIAAWNLRKVLFAHTPNLVVTLTHLALYRNVSLFVMFQTLALTISAVSMRFPRYGAPGVVLEASSG